MEAFFTNQFHILFILAFLPAFPTKHPLLLLFPELLWRYSIIVFKELVKIGLILIATGFSHINNLHIAAFQ